jgi:TPR repeat protein
MGTSVSPCLTAALWFRCAADAGYEGAAMHLSNLYSLGLGRAWQIMPATFLLIVDPRLLC